MVPRLCNLESEQESYVCRDEGRVHCDEGVCRDEGRVHRYEPEMPH